LRNLSIGFSIKEAASVKEEKETAPPRKDPQRRGAFLRIFASHQHNAQREAPQFTREDALMTC